MCFWEPVRGYLFTGDLVYKEDTLTVFFHLPTRKRILIHWRKLQNCLLKKIFPAHHTLDIEPEILFRMRDAFRELDANKKLQHGSGKFDYGDWALWL